MSHVLVEVVLKNCDKCSEPSENICTTCGVLLCKVCEEKNKVCGVLN